MKKTRESCHGNKVESNRRRKQSMDYCEMAKTGENIHIYEFRYIGTQGSSGRKNMIPDVSMEMQ